MLTVYELFRTASMHVAVVGLLAIAALALGRLLTAHLKRLKVQWWPVLAALVLWGGTKPAVPLWRFFFANGLTDNGSICEGNEIRARWTATPVILDGHYVLKMNYRDATVTNAAGEVTDDWHPGEDGVVNDLAKTWTVPDATNMQVMVWAEYVAPVVIHTNGVYRLGGTMREMGGSDKYVTPTVQIRVNLETGETEVLTPTNRPPSGSLLNQLYNESNERETRSFMVNLNRRRKLV